jgi:hypothetical protein
VCTGDGSTDDVSVVVHAPVYSRVFFFPLFPLSASIAIRCLTVVRIHMRLRRMDASLTVDAVRYENFLFSSTDIPVSQMYVF